MLKLIPSVKSLAETGGVLKKSAIFYNSGALDPRLEAVLSKLPFAEDGAPVTVSVSGTEGEGYSLQITEDGIAVAAEGPAGAFYALQTLRQIFANGTPVPCLKIEDAPDFPYRGFYHDVTRGRIPTVETLKDLIDKMAYYKLNSLQLYVEHVFEFEETKDLQPYTGYLTGAELEELDAYCKENFIDFIPSLSTFGHLYEMLQLPKYQHLRVLDGYQPSPNFWHERMAHHTVDPTNEESIGVIRSLIDQYAPHFTSGYFNICCDETFDLTQHRDKDADKGRMYVDFVQKIIDHVKGKDKKVMMWADILLKHPETIDALPADTCFLNWTYRADPPEAQVEALVPFGRPQIVCPGTTTWSRLCENVQVAESNIGRLAEYGYKHGAIGVLNTNWGDWSNPCSIELALYGLAWGAEKSWSVATAAGAEFHAAADAVVYGKEGRFAELAALSALQTTLPWNEFARAYFNLRYAGEYSLKAEEETLRKAVATAKSLIAQWEAEGGEDPVREEMLLAAEGMWCMAELSGITARIPMERTADVEGWLKKYAAVWRRKNKESELRNIVEMFTWLNRQ